jgi:hypothetical protein
MGDGLPTNNPSPLIASRRDAELDHFRQAAKMLGKRFGISAVPTLNRHSIFELFAPFDQAA